MTKLKIPPEEKTRSLFDPRCLYVWYIAQFWQNMTPGKTWGLKTICKKNGGTFKKGLFCTKIVCLFFVEMR